jgi:serralysin
MKSKFAIDPLDAPDGFFNPDGAGFYANFFPAAGEGAGNRFPGGSPPISPTQTPTLSVEAVEAQSAQNGPGGPGSVVAETSSSGFTINLLFDAAAMAAPLSFRAGIEQAASILAATITDKITVNIKIDYSGTGGGAAAGPDNGQYVSYSTVKADLINNATPGDTTFNVLPSGSTIQGQSSVAVWNAQLKLFGLLGANDTTTDDGSATFATDINSNLLVGVALHELTHALGRIPYGPSPDIFDFYRFTSAGTRLFSDSIPSSAAYFSVDGGNTKIADYGLYSDPSDFLNPGPTQLGSPYSSLTPNDPFNEIYTGSTLQTLTAIDKEQLDALGFNTTAPVTTTVIEAFGSTSLVAVGNNYFLDSISSGTGPSLKYGGVPVVLNPGGWSPIGVEQTATGYVVAWKEIGADQYTEWSVDSNGNYISNLINPESGNSLSLENAETVFHQDLNGDGIIGVPASVTIEAFGSTKLVQVGNNYFLDSISSGTGPELMYQGSPVSVGEFGAAVPTGVEAVANGYEVAWKNPASGLYAVWSTDSSGNYTGNFYMPGPGTATAFEALEPSFHQDLNGDGMIGIPASAVIEAVGLTELVQVGNNYFLDSISSGTGPELMYQGAPVSVGEFGAAVPIGVEPVANGYEVAWKNPASGLYAVWSTDSSGNYTGNFYMPGPGTATAFEALEPSFHQDLNGDGVIGVPAATGPAAATPAAQAPPVTVVNNDTFVFRSGLVAGVAANAGSTDTTAHDGFAWVAGNAPAAALPDAQAGLLHPVFQWADGDPSHHDGAPAMNFHLTDPHASGFIIG